ncbi:MAG: LamG domain-containing protein, partial [Gemmataceae bacterium]
MGRGYLSWTNASNTTFENVRFDANDNRVAIYYGTQDYLTVTNSRFTGSLFRGIRGGGEFLNISHNSFEEKHYWYSPIYFEYGGATSGIISFNYFANRVGVNNPVFGEFKSDGTGLYSITNYQPNKTTADGLQIIYNTFDFRDAGLTNSSGATPMPVGVFIDPLLPSRRAITVQNSIFRGFDYIAGGLHRRLRPASHGRGQVENALTFDGTDDFATFQSWPSTSETGFAQLLGGEHDQRREARQFFEGPNDGNMEFQFRTNSGGQFYGRMNTANGSDVAIQNGSAGAGALNNWTLLTYTWDKSAGTLRVYVNGSEVTYLSGFDANISNWVNAVDTSGRTMFVGRDPRDNSRFFQGRMDDVAWFNDVLTPAQISSLWNGGTGAVASSLGLSSMVAYWNMDSAVGTVLTDSVNSIPMQFYNSLASVPEQGPVFQPTKGRFGGALEFDGLDDYGIFQSPNFDIGTQGSLNFWINANNFEDLGSGNIRNQFFEGPDNSGFEFQYRSQSGGQFYGSPLRGVNPDDYAISAGGNGVAANTNRWLNLQYTWQKTGPTTGVMRIYVDNVEVTYLAAPNDQNLTWTNVVNTINGAMNVARDPGSSTDPNPLLRRYFGGLMDDVAWFNQVLTPAERTSIFNASVGSVIAGDPVLASKLITYWNFDDAPGTTIVPSNAGYSIPLVLYPGTDAPQPPPITSGYAVLAPAGVVVNNNLFWNNDNNYNPAVTVGPNGNIIGNPLFQESGPTTNDYYAIYFGSPAAFNATGFPTVGMLHIGAYQDIPLLPAA